MGQCKYCGDSAGVFRTSHKDCVKQHNLGSEKFQTCVVEALNHQSMERMKDDMKLVAQNHFINDSEVRMLAIQGWERAVNEALSDHLLSIEEEAGLASIKESFGFNQKDLDANGSYTQLYKSRVLRDLSAGIYSSNIELDGHIPFNFQKTEKLIWIFNQTRYYEDKSRKEFVGRSKGVSVRVAKGVYFRVGASRGHSVVRTDTLDRGVGLLAITNRHVYFAGDDSKSVRIRHDKIVTIEPFEDGVELQRDAATAKPQKFVTGDGWFTYNLLQNATNV